MNIKLDSGYINNLLKTHLDERTSELERGLKGSLDSAIFSWGSVTHRKNGEIVSDPRNAIDTGVLQESIHTINGKGLSNTIKFDVEYAANVLEHSSVDFIEFTIGRLGE